MTKDMKIPDAEKVKLVERMNVRIGQQAECIRNMVYFARKMEEEVRIINL